MTCGVVVCVMAGSRAGYAARQWSGLSLSFIPRTRATSGWVAILLRGLDGGFLRGESAVRRLAVGGFDLIAAVRDGSMKTLGMGASR